ATTSACASLEVDDYGLQSMEDCSPAKWHLAHTTWFFEAFVLEPAVPDYSVFHEQFGYLFNSYYEAVGSRHPRPRRGLLSRPTVGEVIAYRRRVDDALFALLDGPLPASALDTIELGVQHEQQHQELLLTDLLHLFAQNPLRPAYRALAATGGAGPAPDPAPPAAGRPAWVDYDGGLFEVGHDGRDFAFDCEGPRHR